MTIHFYKWLHLVPFRWLGTAVLAVVVSLPYGMIFGYTDVLIIMVGISTLIMSIMIVPSLFGVSGRFSFSLLLVCSLESLVFGIAALIVPSVYRGSGVMRGLEILFESAQFFKSFLFLLLYLFVAAFLVGISTPRRS